MNDRARRIIVALDASPHSQAALDAVAALAERIGAEVVGVFVEDLELVHLARFPFAREVGLTSARGRALNPESMERSLKAQAAKARTALLAAARRHNVPWSFRVTRGQVTNELLAAAAEADMLALGRTGHMESTGRRVGSTVRRIVTEARCSVLIQQRPVHRKVHPRVHRKAKPEPHADRAVLVLYEDSALAEHALVRGRELAESSASNLVIVLPDDANGQNNEAKVRRALEGTKVPVHIDHLRDGVQALRRALDQHGGGIVVLAQDSALLAQEPDLIGELGYPVLLAR